MIRNLMRANHFNYLINSLLKKYFYSIFITLSLFGTSIQASQNDPKLDQLFLDLQNARTSSESISIELKIWKIWTESDQENINNLMQSGINAMLVRDYEIALKFFNKVVEIDPNFAEGWNKRATIHYLMKNYDESIYDIRQTLILEPRHFGALSGLGLVYREMNLYKNALDAFREALKIYPQMRGAQENVKTLKNQLKREIL